MDEIDRAKEYTLVYGGDGKLYAVGKNQARPIDNLGNNNEQQLIQLRVQELETAQNNLEGALLGPLGSGVRVRVPKILD